MALLQRQFDDALRYSHQSLEIRREIGDQRGACESLAVLATALVVGGGDEAAAVRFAQEALQIGAGMNYTPGIVYGSALLGEVDLRHGDYDAATDRFRVVLNEPWEVQQEPMMFLGIGAMAQILADTQGRREDALALAEFVLAHPRNTPGLTDQRAQTLQKRLSAELPEDVAAAAKARGLALSFDDATALALS
jgi:hypothetical protein